MKFVILAAFLVFLLAGTAGAATVDFRDAAFSGALNQSSFSANVDGNTITVTAMRTGAKLWWDPTDGFGVQSRKGYENDEIEGRERLKIGFSVPVHLSGVLITDLFHENGYLERGFYKLNGTGKWISFSADPGQRPSTSNGELMLSVDPSISVSSILFRAPGRLPGNQGHEFSVAALIDPPTAVPIPAAVWLLGSGLIGLVTLRRRRS
jgi:hypothetical protein